MNERDNIVASVDYIHMMGWKNHESLQTPKAPGSGEMSIKEIISDIEKDGSDTSDVKFGTLIEEGDEVRE